ncbi:hypothetical protein AAG906_026041 [Vitis piasezkii]
MDETTTFRTPNRSPPLRLEIELKISPSNFKIGSSRWGCNYGDACFPNRALKWYIVCKKWTSESAPKVQKKTAAAVLFASLHFACFSSLLLFACARVST